MGCDIHSRAEVCGDDGIWRAVGRIFPYPYHNPDRPTEWEWFDSEANTWDSRPVEEEEIDGLLAIANPDKTCLRNRQFTEEPLLARNYRLFACLAGVRNGSGFGGVMTGNEVVPIAEPRGVPEDASPEWLSTVEQWDVDMHSHSWLTAKEIIAYDWNREVLDVGYMTEQEYLTFKETGEPPSSHSGGVFGHSIVSVTASQYNAASASLRESLWGGKSIYVQGHWPKMLRHEIGEWFFETLDLLKGLHPDPAQVRVVFGFDN